MGITVQPLRVPRLRHNRIRLDEAPYRRVVVARVVVVQPNDPIPPLAGETVGRGHAPPTAPRLPIGIIPQPTVRTTLTSPHHRSIDW